MKLPERLPLVVLLLLFLLGSISYWGQYPDIKHGTLHTFPLSRCSCNRTLPNRPRPGAEPPLEATTCSEDAWARGSHQKVVAFSFFGAVNSSRNDERKYVQGIEDNLGLVRSLYGPEWTMRLYYSLPQGPSDPLLSSLCLLACSSPQLDLCYARKLPGGGLVDAGKMFPRSWRFLATLDPQVDLMVSRDLDSRLTMREVAAVREWEESGAALHVMRDHPQHKADMLAGMWGARMTGEGIRRRWSRTWATILRSPHCWAGWGKSQSDQRILMDHVWPWGRKRALQHDSFSCELYPGARGFPTPRVKGPANFVGSVESKGHIHSLWTTCPKRCRRRGHPGWKHC